MKEISVEELSRWQAENYPFLLIDVREQFERDLFNIGGIHIPMSELMERKDELKQDIPVIIYCEKGIRSSIIIQRLEQSGFENLYNLSGGMNAWKRATH